MERPMLSPFVIPPNARWAYAAICLMGRERLVGKVYCCQSGGFYVQPWGGAEFDGEIAYLGPCAIFTMHDITEAQAVATAQSTASSGSARLPDWVVATTPLVQSTPTFIPPPLRDDMKGDHIAIDGEATHVAIDAIGYHRVYLMDGRSFPRAEWAIRVTAYEEIPF